MQARVTVVLTVEDGGENNEAELRERAQVACNALVAVAELAENSFYNGISTSQVEVTV